MEWADYLRDQAVKYRQLAETAEDLSVKEELLDLAAIARRQPIISRIVCQAGNLEGIVSKRKDLPYRSGRSPDWLKMKTLSRGVPETPPFELEERSGGVFVTTGPQPWRILKTQHTQGGGISPRGGDAVREQHPPTAAMSETMQGGAALPQDGLHSLTQTQPKTPAIGDTAATAIWVSVTSWH
jgi:hypothetical protein